jgi:hypothetical protein
MYILNQKFALLIDVKCFKKNKILTECTESTWLDIKTRNQETNMGPKKNGPQEKEMIVIRLQSIGPDEVASIW